MKISVNDVELFSLSDIQKQVIGDQISSEKFDEDVKRRLQWVVLHKHEQCMARLRKEWMPKLKGRVESVPVDDDAFALLVFGQSDYKDRKARDIDNIPAEVVVP